VGLAIGVVVLAPVETPPTPAAFGENNGDGEAPVVLLPWPAAASAAAAAAAPAASGVVEVLVAGDEAGVVAAAAEAAVWLMPGDKGDGAFGDVELTPGDATPPGGVLIPGEMSATGDEPAPVEAATPGEEALALVLEAASAAAVAAAAAAVVAAGDVELVKTLVELKQKLLQQRGRKISLGMRPCQQTVMTWLQQLQQQLLQMMFHWKLLEK